MKAKWQRGKEAQSEKFKVNEFKKLLLLLLIACVPCCLLALKKLIAYVPRCHVDRASPYPDVCRPFRAIVLLGFVPRCLLALKNSLPMCLVAYVPFKKNN